MENSLFVLPVEICEHIFSFCKVDDLVNLACCNKFCHNRVSHRLFEFLIVHWIHLNSSTSSVETKANNLKFTKFIQIEHERGKDFSPWHALPKNFFQLLIHCNNLEHLRISYIEGNALKKIFQMNTKMKCLELAFSRNLHIRCWKASNLVYLERLALHECEITDPVLNHIVKNSKIKDLDLSTCYAFSMNGLSCIGDMIQLKKLKINGIYLGMMDGLSWIQNLKNLDVLNLRDIDGVGMSLNKDFQDICTSLVNLDYMEIAYTNMEDDALAPLKGMTSLRKLELDKNYYLSDSALMYVSTLTSLTELSLSKCIGITDYGVGHLNSLKSLRILKLDSCSSLTDLSLKNLKLVSLKTLNLSLCLNISNDGLCYLKELVNLDFLNLVGIDVTDSGLMQLVSLKLKWLAVKKGLNGLTTNGISQFCDRTNMIFKTLTVSSDATLDAHLDTLGLSRELLIFFLDYLWKGIIRGKYLDMKLSGNDFESWCKGDETKMLKDYIS